MTMHEKNVKLVNILRRIRNVYFNADINPQRTPLQDTWAILNRGSEVESNIYEDKWIELFFSPLQIENQQNTWQRLIVECML